MSFRPLDFLAKLFSPRARRRGDFDHERFSFTPIDVNDFCAELEILQRAKADGEAGSPTSNATQRSGTEREIIAKVNGEVLNTLAEAKQRLESLRERINDREQEKLRSRAADIAASARQALERMEDQARPQLERLRTELERAERELRVFRDRFGLKRSARRVHLPAFWSLFLAAVVLEGALNTFFFYQASPTGITGAFFYAFVLALVDMLAVSWLGRHGSRAWAPSAWRKVAGVVTILVGLVFVLGYNLVIANVRELISEAGAGPLPIADAFADPFGLADYNSWLLFIVASFLSLGAFSNALFRFDPLPEYARFDEEEDNARRRYLDSRHDLLERAFEIHSEAIAELTKLADRCFESAQTKRSYFGALGSLKNAIRLYVRQSEEATNAILGAYQTENEKARGGIPSPDYFQEDFTFRDERLEIDFGDTEKQLSERRIDSELKQTQAFCQERRQELDTFFGEFQERLQSYAPLPQEAPAAEPARPLDHG